MIVCGALNVDAHPRQSSIDEVNDGVNKALYVVQDPWLLALVVVTTHVGQGTDNFLLLLWQKGGRDLLAQSEVDEVDESRLFLQADGEVVRLDIAMEVADCVNCLNSVDGLECDHEPGFG